MASKFKMHSYETRSWTIVCENLRYMLVFLLLWLQIRIEIISNAYMRLWWYYTVVKRSDITVNKMHTSKLPFNNDLLPRSLHCFLEYELIIYPLSTLINFQYPKHPTSNHIHYCKVSPTIHILPSMTPV